MFTSAEEPHLLKILVLAARATLIVCSSHGLTVVEALSTTDTVLTVNEGKIIGSGLATTTQLLAVATPPRPRQNVTSALCADDSLLLTLNVALMANLAAMLASVSVTVGTKLRGACTLTVSECKQKAMEEVPVSQKLADFMP